ncbi:MAG: hypothetical protein R3298_04150 [Gammaproteobacteria bacterium]|nr:hypothetical protein [Gammaproteobacteria bacterium]
MEALIWILFAGALIGLGVWFQARWLTRKQPGRNQLDDDDSSRD